MFKERDYHHQRYIWKVVSVDLNVQIWKNISCYPSPDNIFDVLSSNLYFVHGAPSPALVLPIFYLGLDLVLTFPQSVGFPLSHLVRPHVLPFCPTQTYFHICSFSSFRIIVDTQQQEQGDIWWLQKLTYKQLISNMRNFHRTLFLWWQSALYWQ